MNKNQRKLKRQRYEKTLNNRFEALNVGWFEEFEKMSVDIKESLIDSLELNQKNGDLNLETFEGVERLSVLVEDHISMMKMDSDEKR